MFLESQRQLVTSFPRALFSKVRETPASFTETSFVMYYMKSCTWKVKIKECKVIKREQKSTVDIHQLFEESKCDVYTHRGRESDYVHLMMAR